MNNTFNNMIHSDPKFLSVLLQLPQFVNDTNADVDMAYDWVADQCNIPTFVHQNEAWDMFYDAFESASDLNTIAA